jgi:tetratricopeptide (TPR) repeat protein
MPGQHHRPDPRSRHSRRNHLSNRFTSLPACCLLAAACCWIAAAPPAAAGEEPGAIQRAIEAAKLEPGRAVSLKGVRLGAGLATIALDGELVPASPIAGRSRELVFLGRGRVTLEPPDAIEGGQLELFTGARRLDADFKEAVLVVGSAPAATALLRKPAAAAGAGLSERAEAVYQRWRKSPERKALHVDAGMLVNALGDPAYEGYFTAWFLGGDLGDLIYQVEPDAREQVTLGHFVPLDATDKEKRKLLRELGRQQRKGRLIGVELEDLGQWDTWVSSSLRDREGKTAPGAEAFEPERYTLDVTLADKDLRLSGRARLELRPVVRGARAVSLRLSSDFKVDKVTGGRGEELFFLRHGSDLTVVLPASSDAAGAATPATSATTATGSPAAVGGTTAPVALTVEYSGSPVVKEGNLFALQGTLGWYPHTGSIDRGAYDVTFHWPRKLDLMSGGRRIDGGEGADGSRWEHRRLDTPSLGFSFEVGHFKIEKARAGHVALQVAFDPDSSHLGGGGRQEVVKTVSDALAYYEELFGPYPADELNVVTVPRDFSQSVPGLVTLSDAALVDLGIWNQYFKLTDRREVIAHEVAHQWWGDLVGWRSYRDQWISEAMANYCALLFAKNRLDAAAKRSTSITHGWLDELAAASVDDRPIEALGPVVLGERLISSRASDAYTAIVYDKGAVVLEMLARALGAKEFPQVLRQVVKASAGRTLSTEDLLGLIGQVTSTDLTLFADQFIYGTGLPKVYYSYRFEPDPQGGWKVKGEARQQSAYRPVYRLVKSERGALDLRREGIEQVKVQSSVLAVPVEIAVFDRARAKGKAGSSQPANATIQGTVLLRGESSEIAIPVQEEPKELWFDPRSEVFGAFFDQNRHPKRVAFFQALNAATGGRAAEAEALFAKALAAPEEPTHPDAPWRFIQDSRRRLNAQIELGRARLYLEQGRDQEARSALDRAGLLSESQEFVLIECRLDLRAAAFDKVFRRLNRKILEQHQQDSLEGLLLLAIAARATGHGEPFEQAVKKARERGADVSLLRAL